MFVEIYNLAGNGQPAWAQDIQRYPEISEEDWCAWKAYFPVCTTIVSYSAPWLIRWLDVPVDVALTIEKTAALKSEDGVYHLFDRIEVWGKKNLNKDPIAVGIRETGGGVRRYLICRWGPEALVPFETIKKRAWFYRLIRLGHPATFLDALFALSMLFVLGRLFSMIFGL